LTINIFISLFNNKMAENLKIKKGGAEISAPPFNERN
jgi:hypothetical protein